MNNLILVRHGQSKYNLERRFTGFYDVGLTQKGKDEAAYAGKLIKNLNIDFDSYFTSMLSRAYDSLNIILKVLDKPNVEINKAWELNERHYGGLTGLNKDETIKKYGDKQVKIWRRSFSTPPPKMEVDHPYKNKIKSSISSESKSSCNPLIDLKVASKSIKSRSCLSSFLYCSYTMPIIAH